MASAVEYGLLVSMIAVSVIAGVANIHIKDNTLAYTEGVAGIPTP